MAAKKQPEALNYCFGCKKPLARVMLTSDLRTETLVCTNKECSRFGLLSVVGYKQNKKSNGDKRKAEDGSGKSHLIA